MDPRGLPVRGAARSSRRPFRPRRYDRTLARSIRGRVSRCGRALRPRRPPGLVGCGGARLGQPPGRLPVRAARRRRAARPGGRRARARARGPARGRGRRRGARVTDAATRWGPMRLEFSLKDRIAEWRWTPVPVPALLRLPPGTVVDSVEPPASGDVGADHLLAPAGASYARVRVRALAGAVPSGRTE